MKRFMFFNVGEFVTLDFLFRETFAAIIVTKKIQQT